MVTRPKRDMQSSFRVEACLKGAEGLKRQAEALAQGFPTRSSDHPGRSAKQHSTAMILCCDRDRPERRSNL